jgi:hypothetical protein
MLPVAAPLDAPKARRARREAGIENAARLVSEAPHRLVPPQGLAGTAAAGLGPDSLLWPEEGVDRPLAVPNGQVEVGKLRQARHAD